MASFTMSGERTPEEIYNFVVELGRHMFYKDIQSYFNFCDDMFLLATDPLIGYNGGITKEQHDEFNKKVRNGIFWGQNMKALLFYKSEKHKKDHIDAIKRDIGDDDPRYISYVKFVTDLVGGFVVDGIGSMDQTTTTNNENVSGCIIEDDLWNFDVISFDEPEEVQAIRWYIRGHDDVEACNVGWICELYREYLKNVS